MYACYVSTCVRLYMYVYKYIVYVHVCVCVQFYLYLDRYQHVRLTENDDDYISCHTLLKYALHFQGRVRLASTTKIHKATRFTTSGPAFTIVSKQTRDIIHMTYTDYFSSCSDYTDQIKISAVIITGCDPSLHKGGVPTIPLSVPCRHSEWLQQCCDTHASSGNLP